jgi:hypothetical protein
MICYQGFLPGASVFALAFLPLFFSQASQSYASRRQSCCRRSTHCMCKKRCRMQARKSTYCICRQGSRRPGSKRWVLANWMQPRKSPHKCTRLRSRSLVLCFAQYPGLSGLHLYPPHLSTGRRKVLKVFDSTSTSEPRLVLDSADLRTVHRSRQLLLGRMGCYGKMC